MVRNLHFNHRVQIENAPALEVIARYDSLETLFYCDPPYVHETRGDTKAYAHEMTDAGNDSRQPARSTAASSRFTPGGVERWSVSSGDRATRNGGRLTR